MEAFAQTYQYPYGSSYLSSYLDEPAEIIHNSNLFERTLNQEKQMRPFRIGSSSKNGKAIEFLDPNQDAKELNAYEGFRRKAFEM